VVRGHYNLYFVLVSLLLAILASYTSIDLMEHIGRMEPRSRRRFLWLLGGATSMGTGIWSMHYLGMLAFEMPMRIGYDIRLTALSVLMAISVSYFTLHMVTRKRVSHEQMAGGSVIMGLGSAAIHYTGMAALRIRPGIAYRPALFAASIAITIVASWTAMRIAFNLRGDQSRYLLARRFGAALIMGAAIAGMHYTGMSAAFIRNRSISGAAVGVNTNWVAIAVTGSALYLLCVTLLVSLLDKRFDLQRRHMNTSLKIANQQLLALETEDLLTGVPNRSSFVERAEQAIRGALDCTGQFTIMSIDLDGFKSINDSLGRSAGDKLLKAFSQELMKCVRRDDMVARLGGDEFVLLLEGIASSQELDRLASEVLQRVKSDFDIDGSCVHVTASIGIATFPQDGRAVEELLKSADLALYEAKQHGRDTYRRFDLAMSEVAHRALQIRRGLAEALINGQISLAFQPQFAGITQELVGAEALIRWKHPKFGDIPPTELIAVAERTGQMMKLCDWVVTQVCMHIKRWDATGLPPVKLSINLSPQQLRQPLYVEHVRAKIDAAQVEPARIMFEITETVAMQDPDLIASVIHQFQDAGFDIAIDDFGTGYSSMAYLQLFRVKRLKIDRFFIDGLDRHGEEGSAIVAAMIQLGHSLQMVVVAEGVETVSQLNKLNELHCDELQGFLLAKPLHVGDFEALLGKHPLPSSVRATQAAKHAASHALSQAATFVGPPALVG
jgi:diguanylate cyclase (GGDEF)-like protein